MQPADPLTLLERKILQFFQEHSNAVETARGLATWLGTGLTEVQAALDGLAVRKWLAIHATGAVMGYTLTQEKQFLDQIQEALEFLS